MAKQTKTSHTIPPAIYQKLQRLIEVYEEMVEAAEVLPCHTCTVIPSHGYGGMKEVRGAIDDLLSAMGIDENT